MKTIKEQLESAFSYGPDTATIDTPAGRFTVEIEQDTDPLNPREEFDGDTGVMYCWHSRYNLGDEQPSETPEDWRRGLACELDKTAADRIDYWENGSGYARLSAKYPQWERLQANIAEYVEAIIDKALERTVILPLYLYDHGGITMSTGAFSCPWDSGQVGWIVATPDKIRENFGVKRISKKTRQRVEGSLRAEVKTYDDYLTGNVYGYTVTGPGDSEDSCWGFYGDHKESGILEYIQNHIEASVPDIIHTWQNEQAAEMDGYRLFINTYKPEVLGPAFGK